MAAGSVNKVSSPSSGHLHTHRQSKRARGGKHRHARRGDKRQQTAAAVDTRGGGPSPESSCPLTPARQPPVILFHFLTSQKGCPPSDNPAPPKVLTFRTPARLSWWGLGWGTDYVPRFRDNLSGVWGGGVWGVATCPGLFPRWELYRFAGRHFKPTIKENPLQGLPWKWQPWIELN